MNNYIIIYSQSRNPIFDIEGSFKSFGFNTNRDNSRKLEVSNYLNDEFVIQFLSNDEEISQSSESKKDKIEQSELDEQYLKISSLNNDKNSINGISNLIIQILIDKLKKPIFHFNKYDEPEFVELKNNYSQQIFNRLGIAEFIDQKPSKIPEAEILLYENDFDIFKYKEVIVAKKSTDNLLRIWYSIGEILGYDGWDMTASNFTPINTDDIEKDISEINYPIELKKRILAIETSPNVILRVNKEISREECSYFIEMEDKIIFREIIRMFY